MTDLLTEARDALEIAKSNRAVLLHYRERATTPRSSLRVAYDAVLVELDREIVKLDAAIKEQG